MPNPFDGRRVAAMVALLVALTAILPPAAAYTLAQWRITRAEGIAAAAAAQLGDRMEELREAGAPDVLAGPGCRLPQAAGDGLAWLQAPIAAGRAFETSWPQDPWGRCYLLNVARVLSGVGGLLISAGPNGEIETAVDAAAPAGDDIAAIVR